TTVDLVGGGERRLVGDVEIGVDALVDLPHPVEVGSGHLAGAHLTGGEEVGELGGRAARQVSSGHRRSWVRRVRVGTCGRGDVWERGCWGSQASSRTGGTEKRCSAASGATGSACCGLSEGRTSSGRVTVTSGIGWLIGSMSAIGAAETVATESRMTASSPAR